MKKIIKLILISVLALSMVACSNNNSGNEDVTEKGEIVIWHTFTEGQNAALTKIADDFNAQYGENWKVVVEQQPYADFDSKVATAVRSGAGPDICIYFDTQASQYGAEGLLVDFLPLMEADGYVDEFKTRINEGAFADATCTDGKMYMWPMNQTANVVFYNVDMYEELGLEIPTTWDEYLANSDAINAKYGVPGMAFDDLPANAGLWFKQCGVKYINDDGKSVGFNTPEGLKVLNWFKDGVASGSVAVAPTGDYFSEDIGAGTVGSYIGSCAGAPYVASACEGNGINWGVFAIPQWTDNTFTTAYIRGVLGFTKAEEGHDKAIYDFAKYWSSKEVAAYWCSEFFALTPYLDAAEEEVYKNFLAKDKAMELAALGVKYGYVDPVTPGSNTCRTELTNLFKQVATGLVTAEEGMAAAEAACNAALAQ